MVRKTCAVSSLLSYNKISTPERKKMSQIVSLNYPSSRLCVIPMEF